MDKNPFAPLYDALPDTLPIFPLEGVLLLPRGNLPLNIFEPRYLAMVEDALRCQRLIGMVQPNTKAPQEGDVPVVYDIGCAGKITEFSETPDGRYLITLTGISRFKIEKELDGKSGYRRVKPDWSGYKCDINSQSCGKLDRGKLHEFLKSYFHKEGMSCDWGALEDTDDSSLITCLSMVCPFDPCEKQALLEADCCDARAKMFMTMLEMASCQGDCESHH
ncbi:MAG: LON peptidase substrate-binding domain-containing protein [Alphaproteobacteria bacterium]|nr:LON peptidase substrate-binding domain-containing protein [Alphaproteobacteria bacterium]